MSRFLAGVLCVVIAVFCLASQAKADVATIKSADNAIWGSLGTSFLNYKESVTPIPDSEHGWLSDPSLAAGANFLTDSGLYFAFDGSYSYGHTNYNGAYYYYPNVPAQGTTHDTIGAIDGKIGRAFPIGNMVMLIPYVDLGFRHWDRDLGGGDVEHYQNFDGSGGLMAQLSPMNRLILTAYASAGSTFGAQMQTSGESTYDLGSAGVYKLGGKVGFDITPRVEVFTTLDYDHLHYAQSMVNADYSYEPGSTTSDTTMRVGMAYHFR